jgi:hypothetical protein
MVGNSSASRPRLHGKRRSDPILGSTAPLGFVHPPPYFLYFALPHTQINRENAAQTHDFAGFVANFGSRKGAWKIGG